MPICSITSGWKSCPDRLCSSALYATVANTAASSEAAHTGMPMFTLAPVLDSLTLVRFASTLPCGTNTSTSTAGEKSTTPRVMAHWDRPSPYAVPRDASIQGDAGP